jgi:Periplasmic binding protein
MIQEPMVPGETNTVSLLFAVCLTFFIFATAAQVRAGTPPASIGGVSPEEAMRLGENMYNKGILPSGELMQAVVKGDILVGADKFTCASCHLRSGFGVAEGRLKSPPIDGPRLYSPAWGSRSFLTGITPGRANEKIFLPAYTDETLARALETGQDPTGRQMDDIMPKYFLNDRDMAIMVYYLKNLSSGPQPGVTEKTLRFATIVGDDVPPADREAMLGPLRNFFNNRSVSTSMDRHTRELQIWRNDDLRRVTLSVWELKGPAETWRRQLEEYYRKDPVFAFVGGMTSGTWEPIHRFCEEHRIPALFPLTDFPVVSESDWYTVYLSKGLYQEGESAARYLDDKRKEKDLSVVQVFRNNAAGAALSGAFEKTWRDLGRKAPVNISLNGNENLTADFWAKLAGKHPHAVLLLWLNAQDISALGPLTRGHAGPDMIFASFSLLGQGMYSLPEKERKFFYLTYPYALPQDSDQFKALLETWAKKGNPDVIAYKMSSLFLVLNSPLSGMRGYVYRDYFLDLVDKMPDMSVGSVSLTRGTAILYPRMSFGQGQRYASKGCYIVQLSKGPKPELVKMSEWVIH